MLTPEQIAAFERERISLTERGADGWLADLRGVSPIMGSTPLIAAFRHAPQSLALGPQCSGLGSVTLSRFCEFSSQAHTFAQYVRSVRPTRTRLKQARS